MIGQKQAKKNFFDPDPTSRQKKTNNAAEYKFSSAKVKNIFFQMLELIHRIDLERALILIIITLLTGCTNKTVQLPQGEYQVKQIHTPYSSNYTICDYCLTYTNPYSFKTGGQENAKTN